MKVFLSWSGDASHQIARALYGWLPMLIQRIEPYISSEIDKGARWSTDIARELESSSFGIACVTNENKEAPWLLFEAGALSKSVAEGRLAPLLCGIEQSDIQRSPISQFQMTKFERTEFLRLIRSINSSLELDALDVAVLDNLFDALWPSLSTAVETILAQSERLQPRPPAPVDGERIMGAIEELITNSRATAQILARPEKLLPENYLRHAVRIPGGSERILSERDARRLTELVSEARSSLGDTRPVDDDDHALVDQAKQSLAEAIALLRNAMSIRNHRENGLGIEL